MYMRIYIYIHIIHTELHSYLYTRDSCAQTAVYSQSSSGVTCGVGVAQRAPGHVGLLGHRHRGCVDAGAGGCEDAKP